MGKSFTEAGSFGVSHVMVIEKNTSRRLESFENLIMDTGIVPHDEWLLNFDNMKILFGWIISDAQSKKLSVINDLFCYL